MQVNAYGKLGLNLADVSMHVSGIGGLILSKNPGFDYTAVKSAILTNAEKIPSVSDKMVFGRVADALCALCGIDTVPGDLSCNGKIELDDAIVALQIVSGFDPEECSECISPGIDVDGKGRKPIDLLCFCCTQNTDC